MSLSNTEQKISDAIASRSAQMLHDLSHLVSIPTGHGYKAGLEETRKWFSARLSAMGAKIHRTSGSDRPDWLREPCVKGEGESDSSDILYADRLAGADDGVRILLSGHIDTVHDPAGTFQKLSDEQNGIRHGPGAADMKGGLIVALNALEVLHALGISVRWSFVLNADEESGSFCSAHQLQLIAKKHDVGLVLEPAGGDGKFVTERSGSAQFRIDAFGRAAHAGRDAALGISAVAALCEAISQVLSISDPAIGRTLNIGPLEGGEATNIVPDHAAAWGNARYQNDEQRAEIDRALAKITTHDHALPRVTVKTIHNRPRKPATAQVMAIAEIALGVARDLSVSAGTISTGGVSDANVLQAAGLPCLDGLGVRGGNLHRIDEFVVTASLVERATILALLINRLLSRPFVTSSL